MVKWPLVILSLCLMLYLEFYGMPSKLTVPFIRKEVLVPPLWESYTGLIIIILFALAFFTLLFIGNSVRQDKVVCKIKGFSWNLNDFCRGWLITGKTGSGKTASAIAHIIHQLFQRVRLEKGLKNWGGVAVDQKGNFFKIIENIARHYGQSQRLVTLQVRPEGASKSWKPKFCYNLLSYPGIPSSTYAKIIVDVAASLGQDAGGGSGGFFKTQAQLNIDKAIELLKLIAEIKESGEIVL